MSDIRAIDMPELRAELLAHYNHPVVADWWAKRPTPPAAIVEDERGQPRKVLNPTGAQRRLNEIDRLEAADLYFVSASMTELAVAAAASLPSFAVEAHDVPSLHGFLIFEIPIAVDMNTEGGHGEPTFISGASWNLVSTAGRPVLWFSFYIDIHRTYDAEVADGTMTEAEADRQKSSQPRFSYSTDAAHFLGLALNDDSVLNKWGRTILTAWLLMRQPLAEVSDVEPDRATRKRLRRAGHEPARVRVIELRRPAGIGEPGDGSRDYRHQWIVARTLATAVVREGAGSPARLDRAPRQGAGGSADDRRRKGQRLGALAQDLTAPELAQLGKNDLEGDLLAGLRSPCPGPVWRALRRGQTPPRTARPGRRARLRGCWSS